MFIIAGIFIALLVYLGQLFINTHIPKARFVPLIIGVVLVAFSVFLYFFDTGSNSANVENQYFMSIIFVPSVAIVLGSILGFIKKGN